MKKKTDMLRKLYIITVHVAQTIISYILFLKKFIQKKRCLSDSRFQCLWKDRKVCLHDKTETTVFDAHYIYHTAWAIRQVKNFAPKQHVDIGSSLYFVAAISAYVPTAFYDYRPAPLTIDNLKTGSGNLLSLDFSDNSIESLSCLHVIEHIGLERYGDPFDPQGDLKAIAELKRVIKPGGRLFLAVPMGGTSRIQYNAHRIYSYKHFISNFTNFMVIDFSFITDSGKFIKEATPQSTYNQFYGCGCFAMQKNNESQRVI